MPATIQLPPCNNPKVRTPVPPHSRRADTFQRFRPSRPPQQLGLPPVYGPGQSQLLRSGDRRPPRHQRPRGGNCQHQRELLLTGLFPRTARCGNGMHQDFPPKLHPGATGCKPPHRRCEMRGRNSDGIVRPGNCNLARARRSMGRIPAPLRKLKAAATPTESVCPIARKTLILHSGVKPIPQNVSLWI